MANSLLQVVGFVFLVIGMILLLRAWGLVNKESPFVTYQKTIGYPLVVSGALIFVTSFFV